MAVTILKKQNAKVRKESGANELNKYLFSREEKLRNTMQADAKQCYTTEIE